MNNLAQFFNPCLSLLSVTTDDRNHASGILFNRLYSPFSVRKHESDQIVPLLWLKIFFWPIKQNRNRCALNSLTASSDLNVFYKELEVY